MMRLIQNVMLSALWRTAMPDGVVKHWEKGGRRKED